MRFGTRVFLILLGLALLTNGTLLFILYRQVRSTLFDDIRSRVLSIAATTGALMPVDPLKELRSQDDEASLAYREVRDSLRKARDANRRDDIFVRYIYTLHDSSSRPDEIIFGVDAEEDPELVSHYGDVLEYEGEKIVIGSDKANSRFTRDKWGEWMSAIVPLRSSRGELVGGLGVDIDAKDVTRQLDAVLLRGLLAMGAASLMALVAALLLARHVTRPLLEVRSTVQAIAQGEFSSRLAFSTPDEFGEVASAINAMAAALEERERLKSAFARYVSRQVMETILESGDKPHLAGDRRTITVLFSDIRGFTSMAEAMSPEDVVARLNEYFGEMINVIFKYHGTLDKFIGDGIMAIFGAPVPDEEHALHAVQAAIEMQEKLVSLRKNWTRDGQHDIRIGIGIHTGDAIVGNIGSEERMEYTAIGDTVNLAARLEAATKDLGVGILVSDSTRDRLHGAFSLSSRGSIKVKGRLGEVESWSVETSASGGDAA